MNTIDKNHPNQNLINDLVELLHFIKTPLVTIKIGGEILKEVLPVLINSYKKDIQINKKHDTSISMHKIDKLDSIINNIIVEANRISEHTKKIEQQITERNINIKDI